MNYTEFQAFKLIMKAIFTVIAIQLKVVDHEDGDTAFREVMASYSKFLSDNEEEES